LKRVIVIGGGLSGLIAAIQLGSAGIPCRVFEKKTYPFHRVCGEYVSNEVVPFLRSIDAFPAQFNPPQISKFMLSSVKGRSEIMPLDLGGFGISRFTFDRFLYEKARSLGVEFHLNQEVETVQFNADEFIVKTRAAAWQADVVLGTYGKRAKLDQVLKRPFMHKRSPYVGVKYHVRRSHPDDLIALHNFPGGYCGMSNVEDGKTTLCYLSHRDNLKRFGNIAEMEKRVLFKNPLLRGVFEESEFLFSRPEVINEISFETKSPLAEHILMGGDSAGMIAPLSGNGMAMAIRAAKIMSDLVIQYVKDSRFSREMMERSYVSAWNENFRSHLWKGRQIQKLFGNPFTSNIAVNLTIHLRSLANIIIRSTHGDPF